MIYLDEFTAAIRSTVSEFFLWWMMQRKSKGVEDFPLELKLEEWWDQYIVWLTLRNSK